MLHVRYHKTQRERREKTWLAAGGERVRGCHRKPVIPGDVFLEKRDNFVFAY